MESEKISFSLGEIAAIKREVVGDQPYLGRISFALVIRLLEMRQVRGDDHHVLFEIDHLERGIMTSTKPATQFKRAPLRPFWHKHFSSWHHTFRNIGERWNIANGNGNRDFDEMLQRISVEEGVNPGLWLNRLMYETSIAALDERSASSRMTGDWILFAKHNDKNYYLDVASHEEGQDGGKLIVKLRNGSYREYPFLFDSI